LSRQAVNNRGEPLFDTLNAKLLLRADVKEGKHNTMTPAELQSDRVEYHPFNPRKFKHHIYQEFCLVKFINWLELRHVVVERSCRIIILAYLLKYNIAYFILIVYRVIVRLKEWLKERWCTGSRNVVGML
jgi:hypothetical protein